MILYVTYSSFSPTGSSGVWKKILGQTKVFDKAFGKALCAVYYRQTAYLLCQQNVVERKVALSRKDYLGVLIGWIEKYEIKNTYVRYPFADKWFVELLKFQSEKKIKTVLEIASYPYEVELSGRVKQDDIFWRREVAKYVDVIATYSQDKEIWGKPCINLVNGICIEDCELNRRVPEKNKIIMLVLSSGMKNWMGYERLIEGMKDYRDQNGKYELQAIIVGDGPEKNKYKKLVEDYGLQKFVTFTGFLKEEQLNEVCNSVDLAINALGLYKKKVECGSAIKGGDYCARGIPMVCGYTDLRFPQETSFVLNVPNDPTPIDMETVTTFFEEVTSEKDYKKTIRQYAEDKLTWEVIMKPVIDYYR